MFLLNKLNNRLIYFYGIIFLAVSLPLSIYTTSMAEIILLVNWLIEGKFSRKLKILKERKSILLITGLYLLHLVGIIYSDLSNLDYTLNDLKTKLPILILPVIIGTSEAFKWKELRTILLFFCVATLFSTLISFGIFLGIIEYEYYDFREISIFISHIRLALMVNLSIFILIYYIFHSDKEKRFGRWRAVSALMVILWLIFFLVLLKSLTGLVILGILVLVLAWIYSSNIGDVAPRFIIRSVILVVPLIVASFITRSIGGDYNREDVTFSELEKYTEQGNRYRHDTLRRATENGNYVWLYISEKEMKEAWNEVSEYKYGGLDRKGQEIKYTLIRYLTSMGLRKDAQGVRQLSKEDIEAIENGMANHIFKQKYSLYPRVYEVIWEIDGYLRGGDPSGHSIAQRIAYLNAAKSIFFSHPWIGVGTGDVQSSFDKFYIKNESKLDKNYRRRAHNQYVTFLITFGIAGFTLAMIFLFLPVFMERRWKDYLFIVFFFIAFLSMLNEDTMETQTGVSFIMFFYSLFLFGREKKIRNG
jgi:O-antigen ligase